MIDLLKSEKHKNIALFRFSLIAPLVNNTFVEHSKSEYFRNISKKCRTLNGDDVIFSSGTIKSWYLHYLKGGFDALYPKTRKDINQPRRMNSSVRFRVFEILDEFPYISATAVYKKLNEEGLISVNSLSLSTVSRFIKHNHIKPDKHQLERLRFEMSNPNDMWQADTTVGPYLKVNGTTVKTYLIAFIDDYSRLITGFKFFTEDTAINVQSVFKEGITKCGKPKRLFVDNGASYSNKQLEIICASCGVQLLHTRIYDGSSKGKIEKFFSFLKSSWMRTIDWNVFESMDDLNKSVTKFIIEYNNRIHSSIKCTPIQRFSTFNPTYIEPHLLDKYFMYTFKRKVKLDSTIRLNQIDFEVPAELVRTSVVVKLIPTDSAKAFIEYEDEIITIFPVKTYDNAHVKRKNIYGGNL